MEMGEIVNLFKYNINYFGLYFMRLWFFMLVMYRVGYCE